MLIMHIIFYFYFFFWGGGGGQILSILKPVGDLCVVGNTYDLFFMCCLLSFY